jgi:hypothetical protein
MYNMNVQHVVIVGTSHSYQIPPNGPAANELRAFLHKICNAHLVQAIAEEMSEEILPERGVNSTLCHELAISLGTPHRYCDLNTIQRIAAGVRDVNAIKRDGFFNDWSAEKTEEEIRKSQSIRERHWKRELLQLNKWPVLFVCGADHVLPFQQLLQENGLSAEIADHDWAPNH